jgi:hypothetical protein
MTTRALLRQLRVLERAERIARERRDLIALWAFQARIRHLLREG